MTLVDANVLIDLFMDDPQWSGLSLAQLRTRLMVGPLYINDIIYAECSTRFGSLDELETTLTIIGVSMQRTAPAALFLAGKAHQNYRRAGGQRTGVLSDFFICAHAAVEGLVLLTRDTRRYRTYFPDVTLLAPN